MWLFNRFARMLRLDQGESARELNLQCHAAEQAPLAVAEAQHLWEPSNPYLNTASYGLPPRPGWEALQAALADWRRGRTSWEHWGERTEAARAAFARLTGVAVNRVTVGATVSELVGLLAAAVPDGTRVVAPDVEFTSLLPLDGPRRPRPGGPDRAAAPTGGDH